MSSSSFADLKTFKIPDIIDMDFIKTLMALFEKKTLLPIDQTYVLLNKISEVLTSLPNVIHVSTDEKTTLNIVGDTHGQYFDVVHIFELFGLPSENNVYLFNGDYVDRGSFGSEIFFLLSALKLAFPSYIHILRGNHESQRCTTIYGFRNEIQDKYDLSVYQAFMKAFTTIPLAAVVNDEIFVAHGGLFDEYGVTIDRINKANRFCEPGMSDQNDYIVEQLLWADPSDESGFHSSHRSFGCCFGTDVTDDFLKTNKLSMVVRSHEQRRDGYSIQHDGKLITIFSAPSYCLDTNLGAILQITRDHQLHSHLRFRQFSPAPFPCCKFYLSGDT